MSTCSRSLEELQRTMVMLALFLVEVLYGKIPDGVDLERRFLTALNGTKHSLQCIGLFLLWHH